MLCCPLYIEIMLFGLKFGHGKSGIYLLLCPAIPKKNPGTGLSDLISSRHLKRRKEHDHLLPGFLGWAGGQQNIVTIPWFPLLGYFFKSKDHCFFYWNASDKLLNLAQTWLPHLDPLMLHLMLLPFPSDLLCFIKPDSTMCPGNYCSLNQYYKTVKFSATLLFPATFP